MTPFLRTDGPITGHLPYTDKPAVPRPTKFVVDEPEPDWRDQAECRGYDPEDWFPVSELESGTALAHVAHVKSICSCCPVIDSCLSWALSAKEQHGIWGGMTAKERASLKRSLGRKSRGAA